MYVYVLLLHVATEVGKSWANSVGEGSRNDIEKSVNLSEPEVTRARYGFFTSNYSFLGV